MVDPKGDVPTTKIKTLKMSNKAASTVNLRAYARTINTDLFENVSSKSVFPIFPQKIEDKLYLNRQPTGKSLIHSTDLDTHTHTQIKYLTESKVSSLSGATHAHSSVCFIP